LLTASGDTCDGPPSAGGGRDGIFDGGFDSMSGFAIDPEPTEDPIDEGADCERLGREIGWFGDAVAAKGFTCEGGSYPPLSALLEGAMTEEGSALADDADGAETLDAEDPAAGAGPLEDTFAGPTPEVVFGDCSDTGFSTGAPQVAQNLPEPMSSAPHFAQFAAIETPSSVTSRRRTSATIGRLR